MIVSSKKSSLSSSVAISTKKDLRRMLKLPLQDLNTNMNYSDIKMNKELKKICETEEVDTSDVVDKIKEN
jgi:hypothetical protein